MMNALRMIWIVSRHYNTDDRMRVLMDLIAVEICEKVKSLFVSLLFPSVRQN